MKVITAKQWAHEFYNRYYKDAKISRLCEEREQIESKWTQATLKVSGNMGRSYRCKITNEESTAGGGRSDQRWVRSKTSVAFIEHENRSEDLSSELAKLCNDVSALKVLMTYVADRDFSANLRRIREHVGKAIRDHIGSFAGELLLMVGGYNNEDWMAYSFVVKSGKCNVCSIRLPKD